MHVNGRPEKADKRFARHPSATMYTQSFAVDRLFEVAFQDRRPSTLLDEAGGHCHIDLRPHS